MIAAAFLLAAAAVPPTPRTVNGQELGKAEEFTTKGPARVCMGDLMITALAGESVTLGYSGIHYGSLRLNRGRSWVDANVGDAWIQPRQVGDVVVRRPKSYIADLTGETKLSYGLFSLGEESKRYVYRGRISGPGLFGDDADRSILRRIGLVDESSAPCDTTYRFGWGFIMGDEPLVERRK